MEEKKYTEKEVFQLLCLAFERGFKKADLVVKHIPNAFYHYTQCQEEMKKELYEFGKLVLDTFHSEGRTHSGKDRLARIKFDEWFNRLNKQGND